MLFHESRKTGMEQEQHSLLGMFNYLGKFVTNLAAKTQDLRTLVKKNAEFVWEETHTKTFEALKAELNENKHCSTLTHRKKSLSSVMPAKRAWVRVYFRIAS